MIRAEAFIDCARGYGFNFYAGVPCSFLTPFINRVIDDPDLAYVSAANEGDAVAVAAGQALAGQRAVAMMQNSGLGNAVSPLTSLNWVFELPILLIVTWRGAPDVADEPQHGLMGQITHTMLETMDVPWVTCPTDEAELDDVLARADAHMAQTSRAFALVMHKNTVEPRTLDNREPPGHSLGPRHHAIREPGLATPERVTRQTALERLVANTDPDHTVIIATTGYTGRGLYAVADRPNHFYMVGSMGCAPLVGLGLAMARPDWRVIVVDGDGGALMRLGGFATLAAYGGSNLVHLLLDNGCHESTGAQATVSAGLSFAAIAAACGYSTVFDDADPAVIDTALSATGDDGPIFASLVTDPGIPDAGLPRPKQSPSEIRERLMTHLGNNP